MLDFEIWYKHPQESVTAVEGALELCSPNWSKNKEQ